MDSTLITHLFKFRRKERKMIHITLMNLQLLNEAHHQNRKPHGSQTVMQNPSLSLAKNVEIECTMICQSNPQCPTLKMTQKLHNIGKPNLFPCLQGLSSSFQELFELILNKELKYRQSNNLPLYARKLIHSFNFHLLVNESSRTSKNVPILHHGYQLYHERSRVTLGSKTGQNWANY